MLLDGHVVSEHVSRSLIDLFIEACPPGKPVAIEDLRKFALGRSFDAVTRFEPTITFLTWLGLLSHKGGVAEADSRLSKLDGLSREQRDVLLGREVITRFFQSEVSAQFSMSGALVLDPGGALLLRAARVPSSLLAIVVLMREFSVLAEKSTEAGLLVFHSDVRRTVIELAQKSVVPEARKMGLDALKQRLAANEVRGRKAEEFVVRYERARLLRHPSRDSIKSISDSDVAAGYDVLSFDSLSSVCYDLFIEVKGFLGEPHFFWSAGELQRAQEYGENYAVYLVDVAAIDRPDYEPTIIRDPARVFTPDTREWSMTPETWFIKPASVVTPEPP